MSLFETTLALIGFPLFVILKLIFRIKTDGPDGFAKDIGICYYCGWATIVTGWGLLIFFLCLK